VTALFSQTMTLAGEDATSALGAELSLWAKPGLLILLHGDLGAGKSTLARAFIRSLMKPGAVADIPSPTFSLIQSYDDTRFFMPISTACKPHMRWTSWDLTACFQPTPD
jgi:tRNA A37 threonylcarbamoyladenosine biosynthesis protein TsaE